MRPGSTESVQADGGAAIAITAVWLLLGLASTIAGCPSAAAGADATSG